MFINTTMGVVFDSGRYPGRLCVCLSTENRPGCGLYSGRSTGFTEASEMGQRMPTIEDNLFSGEGFEVFEIIQPRIVPPRQFRRYHYAAISWENAIYASYPRGSVLILTANNGDSWDVCFAGVRVILSDFGVTL